MKKPFISVFILVIVILSLSFSEYKNINAKLSERLTRKINAGKQQEFLVWIFFKDKGNNISEKLSKPLSYISKTSIERRMKRKAKSGVLEFSDLALNNLYIDEIIKSGIKIKNTSKWLNAVSCYATAGQINLLAEKSFVNKIDLVNTFKKDYKENNKINLKQNLNLPKNKSKNIHTFDYGDSYDQVELINVPMAHDSGYCGQNVLIASFDSGFDNLAHPCFDSIKARGLRTYDFVNHDTIVGNVQGHQGDGSHGTRTLSLLCGFSPGFLISPAFRSKLILCKTENTESETPVEEDNWVAAAEWVDSLGADVITSSLGYLEMDPGSSHTYDWTDMDGRTAVVTIGANWAANKGIVVCNSAGNNGLDTLHNSLNAPADGFDVISVGSVDYMGDRSFFSSVGPTVDGRIKPEVMALGEGNIQACPGYGNDCFLNTGAGTSFSCPMSAGVVAMLLSAKPDMTVYEVREVLKETASNSYDPNNEYGWGIVDAWSAIQMAFGIEPGEFELPEIFTLDQNYPNPFNPSTNITYTLNYHDSHVTLKIYDLLGREIRTLVNEFQDKRSKPYMVKFDASGLPAGVYFYKLTVETPNAIYDNKTETKKMVLVK
jgi:hypothetical protein